jgi:hypothetical protein
MPRVAIVQAHEFTVQNNFVPGDDVLVVDLNTSLFKIGDGVTQLSNLAVLGSSTNPRVTSISSSATPTPSSITDDVYILSALAVNAVFGSPGVGAEGQILLIRIKDAGVAKTLGWNGIYRFQKVAAPTTTVVGETMYAAFRYNLVDSVWDCLAVSSDADTVNAVTGYTIAGAGALAKALVGDGTRYTPSFPVLIPLVARNVALLTAGAPADIATLTVPTGVTRYRFPGSTGPIGLSYLITESQVGNPAAGTCELRDAAAGAGNQVLSANAPPNGAGLGTGWPTVAGALLYTSGTLTVRQTANSLNAANVTFMAVLQQVV